jgi:hypothetical protein
VLAALVTLLLAGLILARLVFSLGAEREVARLKATGLPTSPREADQWYEFLNAKENGALAVIEALNHIVQSPPNADPNSSKFKLPPAGLRLSDEYREVIRKHLARNQTALVKLREVDPTLRARYPIDLNPGFATLLPHLSQIKSAALLLKWEAIDAAEARETERAATALLASIVLANTLVEEPILISQLVRIACLNITFDAMERALSVTEFSDEQLGRLFAALRDAEHKVDGSLHRSLIGERALALPAFEMSLGQLERLSGYDSGESFEGLLGQFIVSLHSASGVRQWDKQKYLELMGEMTEASSAAFPERLKRSQETIARADSFLGSTAGRLAIYTRQLLPSLYSAVEKDAFWVAQLRCAVAGLAVERHRVVKGGQPPESLADLVPRYLPEVPTDPFDGAPLQLQHSAGAGFVVRAVAASELRKSRVTSNDQRREVIFLIAR